MTTAEREALRDFIVAVIGSEVPKAVMAKAIEVRESVNAEHARFVEHINAKVQEWHDAFDERIKAIPVGLDSEAVAAEVARAMDAVAGTVDPDVLRNAVSAEVTMAVGSIDRESLRGEPGKNCEAKDADPEVIRAEVAKAVAAIPPAPAGKDGKNVKLDVVKALVAGEVAQAVSALPLPKDGRDGVATRDELHELVKVGVAEAVAAIVPEVTENIRKDLPKVEYRGVWQENTLYTRGHLTTWGGSLWHCNVPSKSKPDSGNGDWTLAAKKGAPGKDVR